uniref:Uncharacterized protein n=1 Tax=Romanomermis culicivorax TaxID=13658 RepID=A0A915L735_ROMCU
MRIYLDIFNAVCNESLMTSLFNYFKIIEIGFLISSKAAFAEPLTAASIISKWMEYSYPTNVTISMYIEGLSSFQASTM